MLLECGMPLPNDPKVQTSQADVSLSDLTCRLRNEHLSISATPFRMSIQSDKIRAASVIRFCIARIGVEKRDRRRPPGNDVVVAGHVRDPVVSARPRRHSAVRVAQETTNAVRSSRQWKHLAACSSNLRRDTPGLDWHFIKHLDRTAVADARLWNNGSRLRLHSRDRVRPRSKRLSRNLQAGPGAAVVVARGRYPRCLQGHLIQRVGHEDWWLLRQCGQTGS